MVVGLLAAYRAARLLTADEHALGLRHARHVWAWERSIPFLPNELDLQHLALAWPSLVKAANLYYVGVHFPLTGGLLLLLLVTRYGPRYRQVRNALATATMTGLVGHLIYPLAPPRMLTDVGFVDTAQALGPSVYSSGAEPLVNQFAAMPSLHVGWSVIVALGAFQFRSWLARTTGLLHVAVTTVVVVVTANHFWVDVAAGAAIATASWHLAAVGSRRSRRASIRERRAHESPAPQTASPTPSTSHAVGGQHAA